MIAKNFAVDMVFKSRPWGIRSIIANIYMYIINILGIDNSKRLHYISNSIRKQLLFSTFLILRRVIISLKKRTNHFRQITKIEKLMIISPFVFLTIKNIYHKFFPNYTYLFILGMQTNIVKYSIYFNNYLYFVTMNGMNSHDETTLSLDPKFSYLNQKQAVLKIFLCIVQSLLPLIFHLTSASLVLKIAIEFAIPLFLSKDEINFRIIKNIIKSHNYDNHKSLGPIIARASLETYVGNKHGIDNIDNKINQFTEGLIGKISEQNPSKETININLIKESNFSVRAKITDKIRNVFCKIKNGSAKSISHV